MNWKRLALFSAVSLMLGAAPVTAAPAAGGGADLKPLARCYATYVAASMAARDAGGSNILANELMSRIDRFVAGRLSSSAWTKMWRQQITEITESPQFASDAEGFVRATMRNCTDTLGRYPQLK